MTDLEQMLQRIADVKLNKTRKAEADILRKEAADHQQAAKLKQSELDSLKPPEFVKEKSINDRNEHEYRIKLHNLKTHIAHYNDLAADAQRKIDAMENAEMPTANDASPVEVKLAMNIFELIEKIKEGV